MRTYTRHVVIIATIALTALICYIAWQRTSKKTLPTPSKELLALQQNLGNHIAKHEQQVWQTLEKIGITKKKCESIQQRTYESYCRQTDAVLNKPEGSLTAQTKGLICEVLQNCGTQPTEITLVPTTKATQTVSSCDKLLFVNEKNFSSFCDQAQRFMIAHEAQHILHKDHSMGRVIRNLLPRHQAEEPLLPAAHPLMQFYRFREERADLCAAMQSNEWAACYAAYTDERMKRYGETTCPTHPKFSERVTMAHNILCILTIKTA